MSRAPGQFLWQFYPHFQSNPNKEAIVSQSNSNKNDGVMCNVHNPGENTFFFCPSPTGVIHPGFTFTEPSEAKTHNCSSQRATEILLSFSQQINESFGCPQECRNGFSNGNTEAFSLPTGVIKLYNQNIHCCFCYSNREMWPFRGMMLDKCWHNGQIISSWLNSGNNSVSTSPPCCAGNTSQGNQKCTLIVSR